MKFMLGLASVALLTVGLTCSAAAQKSYSPGVTDTEIKIGQTMPYSGPVSNVAVIGRTEIAYFQMRNEQGGVNGRKVTLISLDDGYSPPKTLEQVRKLVEEEQVLAVFGIIGTPTSATVQRYLNDRKVPQLFIQSGAPRFADPQQYPWTMPISPGYADEARVYARYLLNTKPDAKIAVLFQNDDFGKAYLGGLKQGLGDRAFKMIVMESSYEATDATVDSQIVSMQASGADVVFISAIGRVTTQAIRKTYDIGWKPMLIIALVSSSVPTVLTPAGPEKAIGALTALVGITPGDPKWVNDPDYQAYLAFMKKYNPAADSNDVLNFAGYAWAYTLDRVLEQCGDNLTREKLMYEASHLKNFHAPGLLPGITFNTTPTDYRPIKQFILHRFDGKAWQPISEVMEISSAN